MKLNNILIKYYKVYLCLCLIFIFTFYKRFDVAAQDKTNMNVLVLNSYQNGLVWTDDEDQGILDTFHDTEFKYTIAVEYMDWKNYPEEVNVDYLYSYLSYKYENKKLDVVITTDDAALEFAINNKKNIFHNAPIVFCGVNETGVQKLTHGITDVTGVVESIDAEKTIVAALKINPDLKEIYVVYDNSESGISTGELTMQEIHRLAPGIKVVSLNTGKYSEILDQVEQAPKNSAILITTYYSDGEGTVIGFEDSCEHISQISPVPVFHLYQFGMDHGAIGGSMLSGYLQGERAAELAIEILKGTDVADIPIDINKTTQYIFDYRQLMRFDIPLNRVPKGSEILYKPFSFFETYKNIVISTLIAFCVLITFICILMFYLRKISGIKKQLYDSNTELTGLYEELTASDEELRQQFDELMFMQKNLKESEERYAQLFERMLNGFLVFDTILDHDKHLIDIRFIAVNSSFEYQTGLRKDKILGRKWSEVFGENNKDLDKFETILKTGKAMRFETHYLDSKDYFLLNAFRISNGQLGVVIENITDYKKAIEDVGKLNEELEQRVIERTNDLQMAITELEAFTYTVSHDLKAPLRAVDGYNKIILEDYQENLDDGIVEIILNVRSICSEMIDMINKLLQYSTTSRSSLHIEKFESKDLITSIFHELEHLYLDRRIDLNIETGLPTIMADRIMLKQVVYNVLSNAMKFTKDKEKAIITVGATITEDEYVFYINDNGAGFDMKYAGKLFSLFQRLHTSDEFEGSGIGLVTIKKIIDKHGGRCWIEGEVNIGTTLWFTLPIQ